MEEEGSSLTPKEIPEKIGKMELDLTLNQIQKSSDLHIGSIPGLQAQPVEQPHGRRERGFNALNMREQPPGHSPAIYSTASDSLPGCFSQAKTNVPPHSSEHLTLLFDRETGFVLAAGGDLSVEITH